jgi:2-iminoacetate synthase ThiH
VKQEKQTLKPGEDYYFDSNGLMVFTAEYHLKRGYCCNSGCRHCPYREKQNAQAAGKPR